jgi:hypothetical protein
MHSPMRFAWEEGEEYLLEQKRSAKTNFFARLLLNYLRVWDRVSADRPDYLVANSIFTQERIKKYYGRESIVIYPPVSICHSERSVSEVKESNPIRSLDRARDDNRCEEKINCEALIYFKSILLTFLFIMLFDHYFWDIQQGQIMIWMVMGIVVGNKSFVIKESFK